ncbi:hypothetical protein Tco_1252394 [Tanacetum coccineum]
MPNHDKSKKCGVYGFLDLELPSDYYKGLVYSLHEENKALKRMNRMPVGVMDDTSGVVSNNSFADIGNVADIGKGKVPVPPFGSPERPRPDVTPRIAESFKSRPCHPELIRMYGYQSTDEYYADYDYWNTWVQDETTDEEDEDEAMGSKRIEKSPTIPVAVLGLCNTLTWVEIEKKLRKKPPMKH